MSPLYADAPFGRPLLQYPLLIGAVAGLYLAFARLDFEAMSVVLVVAGLLWQVLRFTLKRILR